MCVERERCGVGDSLPHVRVSSYLRVGRREGGRVGVCVCVCERERERESSIHTHTPSLHTPPPLSIHTHSLSLYAHTTAWTQYKKAERALIEAFFFSYSAA